MAWDRTLMQHSLPASFRATTATTFKSQKILFKARALGLNLIHRRLSTSHLPILDPPSAVTLFTPSLSHPPTPCGPLLELREGLRYTYFELVNFGCLLSCTSTLKTAVFFKKGGNGDKVLLSSHFCLHRLDILYSWDIHIG